jgi:hypothetical protein
MNKAATTLTTPTNVERVVRKAREMYPDAEIRVRRGRVFAIDGDVIRLILYRAGRATRT